MPLNPCPDCPAYALGDGSGVLVDDRGAWYDVGRGSQLSPTGPLDNQPPPDYGCGLWLELHVTNSLGLVTIHNTIANHTYRIWSSTDLTLPLASWTAGPQVTASGDPTVVTNTVTGPIRFYRASEARDYATNLVFDGVSAAEVGDLAAPDCMGAAGMDRFVELINGQIRVFNKANGHVVTNDTMDHFFTVRVGQTDYPAGSSIDPRIIYDPGSSPGAGRWTACAIDVDKDTNHPGSHKLLLSVSRGSSPDDLTTNGWARYVVNVVADGLQAMGLDANGVYLDKISQTLTQQNHTIVVLKKSDLYNNTLTSSLLSVHSDPAVPTERIQPACDFDSPAGNGYTFLLAKGVVVADPSDERTFWTVQEYAGDDPVLAYPWKTVIGRVQAQP
jgi:hypothetical protein